MLQIFAGFCYYLPVMRIYSMRHCQVLLKKREKSKLLHKTQNVLNFLKYKKKNLKESRSEREKETTFTSEMCPRVFLLPEMYQHPYFIHGRGNESKRGLDSLFVFFYKHRPLVTQHYSHFHIK